MGKTKYFLIEVGQAQPEYLLYYCSTKMVVMEKKYQQLLVLFHYAFHVTLLQSSCFWKASKHLFFSLPHSQA